MFIQHNSIQRFNQGYHEAGLVSSPGEKEPAQLKQDANEPYGLPQINWSFPIMAVL